MEIQIKNEDEKRAEQAAVLFVYGVNFTDCLRINGIATELEVEGKVIQAHRVYGAWGAFLIAIGEVTGELTTTTTRTGNILEKPVVKQPTVLTNEAERLREKMFDWIRSSYGKAYKEIKTEEEMAWLRQVIRFVVYQRIMENKYHQWVTEGSGFEDEAVARKIEEIYRFRVDRLGTLPPLEKMAQVTDGKQAV